MQQQSSVDKARYLSWSFGTVMGPASNNMTEAYVMRFIPDHKDTTFIYWSHSGNDCNGHFDPKTGVITLNFDLRRGREKTKVIATYHAMDANTMAVCIVEVRDNHPPTLEYGNMYRVQTKWN